MTNQVIAAPSVEPITLAQARLWCRIDTDDTSQDTELTMLIAAVRKDGENLTRRAFVARTLEELLPDFPCGRGIIELPYPPLRGVISVKYTDTSGVEQTVDPSEYQVDTVREPGLVMPAYGSWWPATRDDFNAVRVRYFAGYAPTGSPDTDFDYRANLPAEFLLWARQKLATAFTHRERLIVGNLVTPLPRDAFDGLLDGLVADLLC